MSNEPSNDSRVSSRAVLGALVLDVALVVTFAAIGRASHDEGVFGPWGSGLWQTAWPFLIALALGWLIARAWLNPASPIRTGLPVWAITVAGGMLLRAVSDQGTAIAFVIVASITLLVFLVGWRTIATWAHARRTQLRPN
ncbi:DUF3054 domain-containing protein [Microbacterium sp. NPDC076911]|uniref:DUF3054 domain-containing protein n=1 Tax=Microbacterium sp. NPDC076911 TaxID=3154958 RepID=UPI003433A5E9